MISCRSLTMRYGSLCALESLNLDVQVGEICALLGPNGAGKSTTLKLLAGLQKPTSGSVKVAGLNPQNARQAIGVMPENLGLFDDLTDLPAGELEELYFSVVEAPVLEKLEWLGSAQS